MIVHPAIAALRSDKALQRRLREQMDSAHADWRKRVEVAPVIECMSKFVEGQPLDELPELANLMTSIRNARAFVNGWISDFSNVLQHHPLAQMPMQHHHSDGLTTIQLANANGVALSLSIYAEREKYLAPQSAVFSDRETHDLVLYGAGEAACHQLRETADNVTVETQRLFLKAGSKISTPGARRTRQYLRVSGRLVVLQLSRVPGNPAVTREYALETGQLLQQSSGNKRASQREIAMAVLSTMDRSDAAPLLADIAQADGPEHLRWEAMRHALTLDTKAGLGALSLMAGTDHDPLNSNASHLLAQLHAAYPGLADREPAQCRA